MTAREEKLMAAQQAWLEKQQIHVSGRIAQELFPKVNPVLFCDVLRREISLSDYGDGIKKFFFTFVVMEPTALKFDGIHYDVKKRYLEVAVRAPYEEITEASQAETIRLMEKALLEGVDQIATLKLAAPFDHKAFKRDVQAIFAREGWYEEDRKQYMKMLERD